jgi:phosphoglycerol transferase
VIVYAESLDAAYGDPALFGRDLLAPLRSLGGDGFPAYTQEPGTSWTIAGMVATQCGVPLKAYTEQDVPRREGERAFLPGATCLGDLLQQRGYRNVFMGGAPLSFAGKGTFLRDHGYTEVYGREEWERAGATRDEFNVWGLYDSSLLQRAKTRLAELHAAGQPFNLTLLTLDTHNPHGFMSPACRRRGAVDFEGIVLCASAQLEDFVRFARDQGFLENTTIVIFGDHLAVPNPVFEKLQQAPQRGMYNVMIGTGLPRRNTDAVVHFDFFPTLVELAGFRVEGDRLGLGYSAIGTTDVARPVQRPSVTLLGLNGSARYRALWSPGS